MIFVSDVGQKQRRLGLGVSIEAFAIAIRLVMLTTSVVIVLQQMVIVYVASIRTVRGDSLGTIRIVGSELCSIV